ncbi:recombinase family protein [Sphingomonas sp.]|uniref:recombinase family protein n=1 Tax=Sphingomonas sp. TaxID=28214 RepID=UPI002D7E280B|nr:recombinase family protein [Sphingomonas sp.]HEU0045107.1 recombinase family protein [Sphingomonas sp.]
MPPPASRTGPLKTLVYARYSSQLQNARSIEDQVSDCRARATREGWDVVEVFTDYAISGAAGIDEAGRPGLAALLARVDRGGVDQLLTESTDRLARHQGDDFALRERLQFAGVRLFTLMEGEVDDITGTIKGLMNARFRKDLGDRTRRGQRGAVSEGRAPGGLAYGYRRANRLDERGDIVRGLREIDSDEAEVVVRIFTEYAAGRSPRAIASGLNADGIKAPRSAASWRTTTILGDRQRHTGMLNNRTYAGVMVYNRTRKVTDPRTRRKLIRPNPQADWVEHAVPDLRIVSDAQWQAAQDRRGEQADRPIHQQRRPKHLLSGLGRCGNCGGGWVRQSHQYWGCARRKDGRGCDNRLHIRSDRFERAVIDQLKELFLSREAISEYLREYHREHARRAGESTRERATLERKFGEATRKVDRLIGAVADGGAEFSEIRDVLAVARRDRDELAGRLASIDALPVLALHPGLAEEYRRQIDQLDKVLTENDAAQLEAIPRLRALIEHITLTPDEAGETLIVEVHGRLDRVVELATGAPVPKSAAKRRAAVR